ARGAQAFDVLWSGEMHGLAIDVLESPDEVTLLADLPGVEPASIDVTLTGNMLTITAHRSVPERAGQTVHVQQRSSGQFTRSIPLPSPVNADAISADARNGVLKIRLPKAERAKPRHIRVQPAGESPGMVP
ncbi:MAG: Hsp20/alpha crystallin family protein, partial [Planctomycetaceae bacterium]